MKTITVKLTMPEKYTLLNLTHTNKEAGWYYGNKEQYWRRIQRIEDKLNGKIK